MAQFRIATWNMDNWKQPVERRRQAWAWLETELAPDVALLQEMVPPEDGAETVWREEGIDEDRAWASAVTSFGPEIEEVTQARGRHHTSERELHRTKPGTLGIARVELEGAEPVTVVSLYGLIDDGYATTTVHRLLSDLVPLLDGEAGDRLVLGGDLNCSTQLEPPYRGIHRNVFDRFAAHGLVNLFEATREERDPLEDCPCDEAPGCAHVQTHRHNRSSKPWCNDYLFASEPLVDQLASFEVVDAGDPSPWDFSDHCPVVATFDL